MAPVSPLPRSGGGDAAVSTTGDWIFGFCAAYEPPVVDLDNTLIAKLLSPFQLERFFATMSARYHTLGVMYRVSAALVVTIVFVPPFVGRWLAVLSFALATPAMVCSYLMISADIVVMVTRQYEFWFLTIMNTILWSCLASFFADLRILSVFGGAAGVEMVAFSDANFRTAVSSIKSSKLGVPALLTIGAAAFFRAINTSESNYHIIPVGSLRLSLVDLFVNGTVTLAIFNATKVYQRRKTLQASQEGLQIIRCALVHVKLQLKPLHSSVKPTLTPSAVDPAACKESHQQKLRLLPLRIPSIDARDTLLPFLSRREKPLPLRSVMHLHACGIIGFVSTVVTLVGSPKPFIQLTIAVISLVSTLIFFSVCAASFQRALTRSLLHNFDFLFSSVQFTLSMLLVSDMMQWDFRAMGAFAWFLWFHLVLFLDTMTPPIKRNLRLRKIYLLPVVVGTLFGLTTGFSPSRLLNIFRTARSSSLLYTIERSKSAQEAY